MKLDLNPEFSSIKTLNPLMIQLLIQNLKNLKNIILIHKFLIIYLIFPTNNIFYINKAIQIIY